jgi:hypothetical protein
MRRKILRCLKPILLHRGSRGACGTQKEHRSRPTTKAVAWAGFSTKKMRQNKELKYSPFSKSIGSANAFVQWCRGVPLRSDGIEVSGNLLPPLAHGLESGGVLGKHEAGVHEANARSVLDPGQNPSDGKWGARAGAGNQVADPISA